MVSFATLTLSLTQTINSAGLEVPGRVIVFLHQPEVGHFFKTNQTEI